jgi:hypothetical protein
MSSNQWKAIKANQKIRIKRKIKIKNEYFILISFMYEVTKYNHNYNLI